VAGQGIVCALAACVWSKNCPSLRPQQTPQGSPLNVDKGSSVGSGGEIAWPPQDQRILLPRRHLKRRGTGSFCTLAVSVWTKHYLLAMSINKPLKGRCSNFMNIIASGHGVKSRDPHQSWNLGKTRRNLARRDEGHLYLSDMCWTEHGLLFDVLNKALEACNSLFMRRSGWAMRWARVTPTGSEKPRA